MIERAVSTRGFDGVWWDTLRGAGEAPAAAGPAFGFGAEASPGAVSGMAETVAAVVESDI